MLVNINNNNELNYFGIKYNDNTMIWYDEYKKEVEQYANLLGDIYGATESRILNL